MDNLLSVDGPGGRTLGVTEYGDPDGVPVLSLHGTPGSRLRIPPNVADVRAAGLRVITYDRPGYGASERHPGRSVVDCVADVEAVADALGLDRFHVAGGSGGGPHALAVAARLPERVVAVDVLVCPAPWGAEGLDWYAGMDEDNVKEFGWVAEGEETLHREIARDAAEILAAMDQDAANPIGNDLAPADLDLIARSDVKRMMHDMVREAMRPGVWGWVDDDVALLSPWGFELDELRVPVTIRYGEQDVLIPAAHGAWLGRHVPGARVVVDRSAGHLVSPEAHLAIFVELVSG